MTRRLDSCEVLVIHLDEEIETWLEQQTVNADPDTSEATQSERNIITWLEQQVKDRQLDYLLAHADDGVIWGRRDGKKLVTSRQHFKHVSPLLRTETLQQARLFGVSAELLLWRDNDHKFHARVIADRGVETGIEPGEWKQTEYFDEPQMLWGDTLEEEQGGFALWREGAQGLQHATPWTSPTTQTPQSETLSGRDRRQEPSCLRVRHYLADEPTARVVLSRLIGFDLSDPDT